MYIDVNAIEAFEFRVPQGGLRMPITLGRLKVMKSLVVCEVRTDGGGTKLAKFIGVSACQRLLARNDPSTPRLRQIW